MIDQQALVRKFVASSFKPLFLNGKFTDVDIYVSDDPAPDGYEISDVVVCREGDHVDMYLDPKDHGQL